MLAKQAWRLIQFENSLLAQSLKARYYPRGDVLQVNRAHNSSFVWRSLLIGVTLLNKGMAWRIGNGMRIRIGYDPWLPNGEGLFHTAHVSEEYHSLTIQNLFSEEVEGWDRDKTNTILSERDVAKLSDVMLERQTEPDQPFWPHAKGGFYTVRSGYHLARCENESLHASSSNNQEQLWKWIWKLEVIPKVKLLIWKIISEALPTKVALRHRSILIDPMCSRCREAEETLEHVFRDCEWTKIFWRASSLRIDPQEPDLQTPILTWFDGIRKIDSPRAHAVFASLIWSVWFARNMLLFQQKMISHGDCFDIAHGALWNKANNVAPPNSRPSYKYLAPVGNVRVTVMLQQMVMGLELASQFRMKLKRWWFADTCSLAAFSHRNLGKAWQSEKLSNL